METGIAAQDGQGSLARYVLSDDESKRIFEREIVPAELGHLTGRAAEQGDGAAGADTPLAVLLVGQTGAGKTRTAPALVGAVAGCGPRGTAHLIADTYKTYHPAYADLAARSPALASPATGPDARRWLSMACLVAAERRAGCVVETACRDPGHFAQLALLFVARGYDVRVVVLAVPEALSRLGVLARFHHALPEARSGGLPLRLTPRTVHDATFAGLLDVAAWLDRDTPAADVVVLRRGQRVAYSYRRRRRRPWKPACDGGGVGGPDDSWPRSAVGPVLLRERRRPLTPDELRLANDDLLALRRLGRPELEHELAEIEGLLGNLASSSSSGASDAHDDDDVFPDLLPFDAQVFVNRGTEIYGWTA